MSQIITLQGNESKCWHGKLVNFEEIKPSVTLTRRDHFKIQKYRRLIKY